MDKNKSFDIIVKGLVQGVGFRYFTKKKAKDLGINGYVENLSDKTVHIVVEGKEKEINIFLEWLHSGPSSSIVEELHYYALDLNDQTFKPFYIKR